MASEFATVLRKEEQNEIVLTIREDKDPSFCSAIFRYNLPIQYLV